MRNAYHPVDSPCDTASLNGSAGHRGGSQSAQGQEEARYKHQVEAAKVGVRLRVQRVGREVAIALFQVQIGDDLDC